MKNTATLFEIEDPVATRTWQRVAPVVLEATEDDVTGVAGIALCGELLDHLASWKPRIAAAFARSARVAIAVVSATARSSSCSWLAGTSSPRSRC